MFIVITIYSFFYLFFMFLVLISILSPLSGGSKVCTATVRYVRTNFKIQGQNQIANSFVYPVQDYGIDLTNLQELSNLYDLI